MVGTDATWTYRGVSATSLLKPAGVKWFAVAVVLDAAKAFIPVLAFRIAGDDTSAAVVGVAVIAGHVWPVWTRFVGGRGQACLLGALLAIDPLGLLFAAVGGVVVGLILLTSVYMARNMGPILLVPWFWATDSVGSHLWFAVGVNVIYWLAVRGDLAEERRARQARRTSELGYRSRFARAWHGFLHEE